MATTPTGTGFALRLERTLTATPERVFDAFTKAEVLARWFGPTDEHQCTVQELDLTPGGRYRLEIKHSGGNIHTAAGKYIEISRPGKLSFTWGWVEKPQDGESRVTLHIEKAGEGTKLVLVQEQFPTAEIRDAHNQGWTGSLDKLVRLIK